jgi:hypothetical protein
MGVAKRFQDEGGKVIVGVIEDMKDIFLPMELDAMEKEGKDPSDEGKDGEKKKRLKSFEGILDINTADSVVEYLKKQDNKDEWFVFCDMNYTFKYAEQLAEFMPHGNFPTAEHRELEVDREKAKQFIENNYPDVSKDEHHEFSNIEEAKKFLETSDDIYVLKGDSLDAPTVVPPTDDPEVAKQLLIEALDKNQESYNAGGLILELKLEDAIELTPERMFYNGKELCTSLDIETKRKYAGDVGGELVGCGTDLIIATNPKDKLNQMAFPDVVSHLAHDARGLFIWDLSLLISKRTGKAYPGEFCANRPGWNAFMTEVEGMEVIKFFNDIVVGKNPMEGKKLSASLRVFNDSEDEDVKIIYPPEIEKSVSPMYVMMKKGELITTGYCADTCIVTGHGDTFQSCADDLYEKASKIALATKKWGYRSKGDFLDGGYGTSLVMRYNYAVQKELITGYEPYLGTKSDFEFSIMKQEHEDNLKKSSQMFLDSLSEMKSSYEQKHNDEVARHDGEMKKLNERIDTILAS